MNIDCPGRPDPFTGKAYQDTTPEDYRTMMRKMATRDGVIRAIKRLGKPTNIEIAAHIDESLADVDEALTFLFTAGNAAADEMGNWRILHDPNWGL